MDQLTILLEKLADKLGTTTEYLWSVLIDQALISAINGIVFIFITIVVTFFTLKYHIKFSKEASNGYSVYYNQEELLIVPMLFVGMVCIIMIIMSLITLSDIITALLNPEYWALEKILNKI